MIKLNLSERYIARNMLFDHQNNLIKMIKLILLESPISRNMLFD